MNTKTNQTKYKVLIVDDDKLYRETLVAMLSDTYLCAVAADATTVLKACQSQIAPDLILLDFRLQKESGIEVCQQLQKCRFAKDIPVVFVTAEESSDVQVDCWKAGASDFVTKPVVCNTLIQRIKHQLEIRDREQALEQQIMRDGLTGLKNRQYLKNEVPALIKQLRRDGDNLSVLMIDIDDFKKYNDTEGHIKGDECIRKVAAALEDRANRPLDSVVRYGGEEFLVILPRTDLRGARRVAQDMCRQVEKMLITHETSAYGVVTISVGVASSTNTRATKFGDLVRQADEALYKGKSCGKNCVVYNSSPKPPRRIVPDVANMRWAICQD
ncbi:diguanylate cyclase [Alteromonas sp. AMM-1]|uniref:GGDEF domain-containing response regulator n=1 Tax=Alteromonas sp. AMM-1 TaxID=3394233 RepID=UPI0039A525F5